MTKVNHYVPPVKSYHYCKKGDSHSLQPLNIVCLDPLCRQNPLGCAVCFSQIHKYHKTISLDDFLNDYQAGISKTSKSVDNRIKNEHQILIKKMRQFNVQIKQKLQNFQNYFQQYFCFLTNQSSIRKTLGYELGINLQPKAIYESNFSDLQKSVKFIISNSLFKQNRIVNVSSILKQNQNKTLALLDKISNQTIKCHREIQSCFKSLQFAKQTLNRQNAKFKEIIQQFNSKNQITLLQSANRFVCKQNFNQKLDNYCQIESTKTKTKPFNYYNFHKDCSLNLQITKTSVLKGMEQYPPINFGIYKHENLNVDEKTQIIKSNITALKPQFALLTPTLNIQPQKQQDWSIKINSCRNFSSKNTLAVGLCSLEDLKKANFQNPESDQNILLVTSQGYIMKDGRCEKSKFIFGEGDTLHLKYDPFYNLLIISKDNGRKITLKTKGNGGLYGCVRMTYASDQVQIV